MVGVARIELATPAMSTHGPWPETAENRRFRCSHRRIKPRTDGESLAGLPQLYRSHPPSVPRAGRKGGRVSHWEASAGATDEWYTPKYIFDALGCRFDQDVASPVERTHVPADSFIFANGLSGPWVGFVWMNPPFGGRNSLAPWLAKFFDHGNGIALTPDRTSAPWFREAWPRAEVRSARWIARQAAVERNDALGSRLAGNRSAAPSRIQWPRHPRHPGDPPCLTSHPN